MRYTVRVKGVYPRGFCPMTYTDDLAKAVTWLDRDCADTIATEVGGEVVEIPYTDAEIVEYMKRVEMLDGKEHKMRWLLEELNKIKGIRAISDLECSSITVYLEEDGECGCMPIMYYEGGCVELPLSCLKFHGRTCEQVLRMVKSMVE